VLAVKATAIRLAMGLPVGGALGYGWHRLVGCSTGTSIDRRLRRSLLPLATARGDGASPLTATPLRGIGYGAVMGLLWATLR